MNYQIITETAEPMMESLEKKSKKYVQFVFNGLNKSEASEIQSAGKVLKEKTCLSADTLTKSTIQSAPSVKLPKVVERIYGGKPEAEAMVFGNGKIEDVSPDVLERSLKELSRFFKREIKPSEIQVIKTPNGPSISHFDPKTKLSTSCACDGELNCQYKISLDSKGNITSYDIENINWDGEMIKYR